MTRPAEHTPGLKMTYATQNKATEALQARGFTLIEPKIMGAAPWRRGRAYAWVSEVWSSRHRAYRFRVHVSGAA